MASVYTPQEKPQRRKGAWIQPVVAFTLIILFVGGIGLFTILGMRNNESNSAPNTVSAFIKYVQEGQTSKAKDLTAPQDPAANIRITRLITQKGTFTKENYAIVGLEAYYLYTIQPSNSSQATYARITVREQSARSWRIVDATLSSTVIPLKPL